MVQSTIKTHDKYGKCICVTDGKTELWATLDIGPRIIRFARIGGENVFAELDPNAPATPVSFADLGGWRNYGGHRLWVSPEEMPRTYFPDDFPCTYRFEDGVLLLEQVRQEWTNLRLSMKLEWQADGAVRVTHTIKNEGAFEIELAPWAISVMRAGGTAVIPLPKEGPVLLPNKNIVLWTYASLSDPRLKFLDSYILVHQRAQGGAFKIGTCNSYGFGAYVLGDEMFVKTFAYDEGAVYPDFGCNFEVYTNEGMAEVESLGALRKLKNGETAEHIETWRIDTLVPKDETQAALDEAADRILSYNETTA